MSETGRPAPIRNVDQPVLYDNVGGVIVPVTAGAIGWTGVIFGVPIAAMIVSVPGYLIGNAFGLGATGAWASLLTVPFAAYLVRRRQARRFGRQVADRGAERAGLTTAEYNRRMTAMRGG